MPNDKSVNTDIKDPLFYHYGQKPLEKEFSNFDKKIKEFFVSKGFTESEAFIAWQLFKLNVKLLHISLNEVHYNGENSAISISNVGASNSIGDELGEQ